jgi:hypothetical protein
VRDIHLMGRSEHREIAAELMELSLELPRLLGRIGQVGRLTTEIHKIDLEFLAKRITERFKKASEMANAEDDDTILNRQLVSSMNGLRKEIERANLILGQVDPRNLPAQK